MSSTWAIRKKRIRKRLKKSSQALLVSLSKRLMRETIVGKKRMKWRPKYKTQRRKW